MYTIGIDLGGTNIAAGVVDESFNIIKKASVPTGAERGGRAIVEDMAALCHRLVSEAGITTENIASVGIAAPGSVDPVRGSVEYANNLPFVHFGIADLLREFFPVRNISVENDANAAALGEAVAGAAAGTDSSVMITLGTGVGGGVIIGSRIFSGFNYAGAELGHMVIEYNGRPCTCGRRGCWEAYSSATALINMTREKMEQRHDSAMWEMCGGSLDTISGRTAFTAQRAGDAAAAEVVDMYISYLACGVSNIINIFQPEVLSIGGGISGEGDYLLVPLNRIVDREQYTRGMDKKTSVRIARLKNDAGIIGAAALTACR